MLTSKLARLLWNRISAAPPAMFTDPQTLTILGKMALMIYRKEGIIEARQFIHLCRLAALNIM